MNLSPFHLITMNKYAFFILMSMGIVSNLQAKVRNGYEPGLQSAEGGLRNLAALLAREDLSASDRKRLLRYRNAHKEFIIYHELTERLLREFRAIDWELYTSMDNLTDARKRPVDVYVKLIADRTPEGIVIGSTNIPLESAGDSYSSNFGPHTVCIRIVAVKHALELLAHEFGHALYQVPNILSYRNLYKMLYQHKAINYENTGHHHSDPSGEYALKCEKAFRRKIRERLLTAG